MYTPTDDLNMEKFWQKLGLPDDILEGGHIAPESLAPQAMERIRHSALQKIAAAENKDDSLAAREKKPKMKFRYIWAGVAAALLLALTIIGPQTVWAAANRLLVFIPGFGVQSGDDSTLFSPDLIRAEKAGVTLEIWGVLSDQKETEMKGFVRGYIPGIKNSYLIDESGQRYLYQRGCLTEGEGTGGSTQSFWINYQVLPANIRQITLVIPGQSDWKITIPLKPISDNDTVAKFGPAVTVNGVTVSGHVTGFAEETVVTLLAKNSTGSTLSDVGNNTLTLTDAAGKSHLLTQQPDFLGSGLAYLSTEGKLTGPVAVKIPTLSFQQNVNQSFSIPVPSPGSPLTLNQSIQIAQFTMLLTKAEIVNEAGNVYLRVYVRTPDNNGSIINNFQNIEVNGTAESWSSQFDEITGGMKWFAIPLPKGTKASIKIGQITVRVNGPWELKIPVSPPVH